MWGGTTELTHEEDEDRADEEPHRVGIVDAQAERERRRRRRRSGGDRVQERAGGHIAIVSGRGTTREVIQLGWAGLFTFSYRVVLSRIYVTEKVEKATQRYGTIHKVLIELIRTK